MRRIPERGAFVFTRDQYPWQNFESLKLHYYYKTFQRSIVQNLLKRKKTDIEEYKNRTPDYPRAIQTCDVDSLADHNRIFLTNSYGLWEEALEVSQSIKPILFYYSWQQFAAFFVYTLFKWPNPAKGHGIRCDYVQDPDDFKQITVDFTNKGFFRRLVDSYVILGRPTAYSPWIPFPKSDTELEYEESKIPKRIQLGKIKLAEILSFDSKEFAKEFKNEYPKRANYGVNLDDLLTDLVFVFAASNIARYRPKIWSNVLDGQSKEEAKFRMKVEKAYERFYVGVNCFLNTVWGELERAREMAKLAMV